LIKRHDGAAGAIPIRQERVGHRRDYVSREKSMIGLFTFLFGAKFEIILDLDKMA